MVISLLKGLDASFGCTEVQGRAAIVVTHVDERGASDVQEVTAADHITWLGCHVTCTAVCLAAVGGRKRVAGCDYLCWQQ